MYVQVNIFMEPFKPKQNHKAVGEHSEAIIIAKLLEVGYHVFMPFGDNLRCDLIIEDAEGKFWKIQCKTGWTENNGAYIEFAVSSSYYHTRAGRTENGRKDYHGEVDYFGMYCPETTKVYLVPISQVGVTSAMLRLMPTKNNQEKNVRWAKDYEL